jgi:hypothetical protein
LVSLDRPSVLLKLVVGLLSWDPGGRHQLHRLVSKLLARGRAARQGRGRCHVGAAVMWGRQYNCRLRAQERARAWLIPGCS